MAHQSGGAFPFHIARNDPFLLERPLPTFKTAGWNGIHIRQPSCCNLEREFSHTRSHFKPLPDIMISQTTERQHH